MIQKMAAPTFQRPYRNWLQRTVNFIGGALAVVGVKHPLSVDWVMRRAERRTGCRDWGDDSFREPLRVLIDSLLNDARLSSFGRAAFGESLTQYAVNRLSVVDLLKRHPEIAEQPVPRPLFVVGLPRTGTTLLYNLLCQDTRRRPLMAWETLYPALPPRAKRDRRRRMAQQMVARLESLAPQMQAIHPLDANGPEECTWLTANTFLSTVFIMQARVDGYSRYLLGLPADAAEKPYLFYRRQLQAIQHGEPLKSWVLKSPVHVSALDTLVKTFPDAAVVQTHRDPQRVLGSLCSLVAVVRGVNSDFVDLVELGREIAERTADSLERAIRRRENVESNMCDVHFGDMMRDPIGAVRRIYDFLGEECTDEFATRMKNWLAENPQHKKGVHRYELSQFGLTPHDIDELYGAYRERFHIAPEASSK